VLQIIADNYNDGPVGLPGNDDSGAMSSWLVFHMMGLYPNAGMDYYLIHTPLLKECTLSLDNGHTFTIVAEGLSAKNRYVQSATLNGQPYPYSSITHADVMAGGELRLKMGRKPLSQQIPMRPSIMLLQTD
jgi:putative alpha-1,2-mannosidase